MKYSDEVRLVAAIVEVLIYPSARNLEGTSSSDILIDRQRLLTLKAELEVLRPGFYDHMREVQRLAGT